MQDLREMIYGDPGNAMIAVDTNLLVYAHRRESGAHRPARAIMRRLAEGNDAWAIPWPCCYEFLSAVTNRRISEGQGDDGRTGLASAPCVDIVTSSRLLGETDDFLDLLSRFVQRPRVHGAVVHDARIAALCVAHGAEALLTRDRDFSLFPELRTRDPFAPGRS